MCKMIIGTLSTGKECIVNLSQAEEIKAYSEEKTVIQFFSGRTMIINRKYEDVKKEIFG